MINVIKECRRLSPVRWLARVGLVAFLGAGEARAQAWGYDDSGAPMITNSAGWAFQVSVNGLDLTVTNCVDVPPSPPKMLDFSGGVEGGRQIVRITGRGTNRAIFGDDHPNPASGLILPGTLESVGAYAFYNCPNLSSLNFGGGNTLKYIEEYAFLSCSGIKGTLSFPASVESIGTSAFHTCSGLGGLAFAPSSALTNIGAYAFQNCKGFTGAINIPVSVKSIGNSAFRDASMKTITVNGTLDNLGSWAFYSYESSLTSVTFLGGYPTLSGSSTIYGTAGGNAKTYVTHANCTNWTGQATFTGSFNDNNAYWQDRPIFCTGHPPSIIVTFGANSGIGTMASQTFHDGEEQSLSSNTFTCVGYTFTGWTNMVSGATYADGQSVIFYAPTTSVPLTAMWSLSPGYYEVILVPNPPLGVPLQGAYTTKVGVQYGQPMPSVTRPTLPPAFAASYEFIGYTNVAGRLYYWGDGTSARDWDQTSGDTLYGVWLKTLDRTSGEVAFFGNGGEPDVQIVPVAGAGDVYAPPLPDPVHPDGNMFLGWNTLQDGTGLLVTNGMPLSEARQVQKVYAQWAEDAGTGEMWVRVDTIDVTIGGDVTLEWERAPIEAALGAIGHYEIWMCLDLRDTWTMPPVSSLPGITRKGSRDAITLDALFLEDRYLVFPDRLFFKVKAIK